MRGLRWQSGHKSLPQFIVELRLVKKNYLSLRLNSFLLRINFKASSEKSAQSWGKTVRGCFDVEDDMAKGIWSKL